MTNNSGRPAFPTGQLPALAVTAAPLLLPLLSPGMIWLQSLIPMVVAYQMVALGYHQGRTVVIWAMLAAAMVALISGGLLILFFGLSMVPLGYILARGIALGEAPNWAGAKGLVYLLCFWLLLGAFSGITGSPGPVRVIQESLDHTVTTVMEEEEAAAAALANLRRVFDRTWPALFTISLLSLVWLNLMASHWLLRRRNPALSPWPEFKHWRLPDHFVLAAALGLLLWLSRLEPIASVGLNLVLIMGMLYFMQGLGVMSFLLAHWRLPPLLRGICYALVLLQVYGPVLLAILGLADVHLDWRRRLTNNNAA
ncbi:DUF2232 domain-containing protein [Desulfurivibrio alkaliphilus]|uniref:DUF2232 domain-containing protein n=1 Tax=Desulfurivibrio alkaliphilus (strain DSM 19089 / UNIQEM U267 / AHT2) TaxID=589865 RepID=D6Z2S2_DESAT|nr:DUF2232 domain-containing protein [Desulfurivibrio alkaliphilus]ADH85847.1 Protein of unknown function DUF2232, membrane [Desulfurivibrio alkaliphilus AHT 2]